MISMNEKRIRKVIIFIEFLSVKIYSTSIYAWAQFQEEFQEEAMNVV